MVNIIMTGIVTLGTILTTLIQTSSKKEIKKIENKIDEVNIESLKNFIVRTLSDIERGIDLDESVRMRLFEAYDKYTNRFNQNSFVHTKWDKLKKEGKL